MGILASPSAFASSASIRTINSLVTGQSYPGYVERSFPVPDNCLSPTGLAWDGENLWLGDGDGWIYKLRPDDGSLIQSFALPGLKITGLAYDSATRVLLASDGTSSMIYKINPTDGSFALFLSTMLSSSLQDVAPGPASTIFYVDKPTGKIFRIDTVTKQETAILPAAGWELKSLAWDGKYLWASERKEQKVYLIDPDKGLVVSSFLAPTADPYGLACSNSGAFLWLVDRSEKRINCLLVRNTDVNYTQDSSFGAHIQFINEVKNKGPADLSHLKTFLSVPQKSLHQILVMPVVYDPSHAFDDRWLDTYGQQAAYAKEPLKVGLSTTPGYEIEFIGFNLRYFLYPEDIASEEFPQAIKDLYVNKGFPPDQDKYAISHPLIQQAAREATAAAPNLYWKYRQINDYVVSHLTYVRDDRWDNAPTVLQSGQGSCSEYTILFIALCRAANLPARYQGGSRIRENFPYTDDVFHRWAEVYFPKIGWVPVDPTWNDTNTEEPKIVAPYFGWIVNSVLVSVTGGGCSTGPDPEDPRSEVQYLSWNYHGYNTWTPDSNVEVKRRFIWQKPSARRLVSIIITPENAVVRLEKGVEKLKATGYFSDQSEEDLTEQVDWKNSDSRVGTMDAAGIFVGFNPGTATITAIHTKTGVMASSRITVTGQMPQIRRLVINCSEGGTTLPPPGQHQFASGTEVQIQAVADTHYVFSRWSGDVPKRKEKDNPLAIALFSDLSVKAHLLRLIYAPINFAGRKVWNRSLALSEYINVLTWQPHPNNITIKKYRIYLVDGGIMHLLVEIAAGTREYWQRRVDKNRPYTYALTAVNDEGREGEAAQITVK